MVELKDDLLAGVPEIAAFLGFTTRKVYNLAEMGELPVFKLGGKIHARKSELERRFSGDVDGLLAAKQRQLRAIEDRISKLSAAITRAADA